MPHTPCRSGTPAAATTCGWRAACWCCRCSCISRFLALLPGPALPLPQMLRPADRPSTQLPPPFLLQAQQSDPANPYSTTSGRIHTLDKFSVAPSAEHATIRIEARMKLPRGGSLRQDTQLRAAGTAWRSQYLTSLSSHGY